MARTNLSNRIRELGRCTKAIKPVDHSLLGRIPYFGQIFPDRELWPVLVLLARKDGTAYIERRRLAAGEKLIYRGQTEQRIFWILAGSAQVVTTIEGRAKVIHEATKGECVGELSVLKGGIRTADVVAGTKGADVLTIDWAITAQCPELGKDFYHLLALHLADKLATAYNKQLKIIANSIKVLHEKTAMLIERNRLLEKKLKQHHIDLESGLEMGHEETLGQAIASIKESLSLLTARENEHNLDKLGLV